MNTQLGSLCLDLTLDYPDIYFLSEISISKFSAATTLSGHDKLQRPPRKLGRPGLTENRDCISMVLDSQHPIMQHVAVSAGANSK